LKQETIMTEIDLFSRGGSFSDQVLQGIGGQAPPRISLADDRFAFVNEAGERTSHPELKLQVVIVGVNSHGPSRQFWGKDTIDLESNDPPKCWSDNGIGPSKECLEPQNATCQGCPKAEWGSAVSKMTGKGIPACNSRKKLAVIVPHLKTAQAWQLNVPVGSFAALKAYVKMLATKSIKGRPIELYDVVTELYMESKELSFTAVGLTPNEVKPGIIEIWDTGQHHAVVGEHDQPISGLLTGPKKQEQISETVRHGVRDVQAIVDNLVGQPRGRGRPPGATNKPREPEKDDPDADVPTFLRRANSAQNQPTARETTARSGVNLNPDPPPSGLSQALEKAFSLDGL
jgi:hypothetical protein